MVDEEDLPSAHEMRQHAALLRAQKSDAYIAPVNVPEADIGEAAPVLPEQAQPTSRPKDFGRSPDRFHD